MHPSIEPSPGWPFTVALTGPVASGKTTAGRMFSALGAAVIEVVVVPDHYQRRIECQRLNAGGRPTLHPFEHPADLPSLRRLGRVLQGDTSEMPYLVLDVPALLESGLFREVNRLLWMDIDNIVQLDRLKVRDGISEARARCIRRSQPGIALGRSLANDVIDNSGSREALQAQVLELHHVYRRLAAQRRHWSDK